MLMPVSQQCIRGPLVNGTKVSRPNTIFYTIGHSEKSIDKQQSTSSRMVKPSGEWGVLLYSNLGGKHDAEIGA